MTAIPVLASCDRAWLYSCRPIPLYDKSRMGRRTLVHSSLTNMARLPYGSIPNEASSARGPTREPALVGAVVPRGAQPNSTLLNMGVLASEEQCRACLEKIIDCAADTLEDLYSMGGMIGEGRFSKVYAGVSERAVETASPREPWRGRG